MFLLRAIAAIILVWPTFSYSALTQSYVAFSLREAQRLVQHGEKVSFTLFSLGGITRVIGMVHDWEGGDIILVGRVVNGQPEAHLDDLVVALRTRLLYNEWPVVSIDPTTETPKTGRQVVNFRGGIAGTQFGKDLLDCDIILKKYSLELLPPIGSVPSYKSLCLGNLKDRIEAEGTRVVEVRWFSPDSSKNFHGCSIRAGESYQTRFWFYPLDPIRTVARKEEGVFCITELRLGISAELEYVSRDGTALTDQSIAIYRIGELFSNQFTEHFREMVSKYPLLKRLKILYDLVSVAEDIRDLKNTGYLKHGPDLAYFLKEYRVSPVQTRKEYDLIEMLAVVERSDGLRHAVQISGGIEFKRELKWLNWGVVGPLREIVLKTRPTHEALSWTLPLEDWKMPNSEDLDSHLDSKQKYRNLPTHTPREKPGCSVFTQSFVLGPVGEVPSDAEKKFYGFPPPPPSPTFTVNAPRIEHLQSTSGVSISPDFKWEEEDLDELKKQIQESRPSEDLPYWPVKIPKEE